ncbi:nuclear transport factor 2 family protein [Shewanella maritima]|uniref:nuclear transport factor 2 family protein n=1 Tax=Shewanella maritima TaxID=2520507 RepID=UPI003736F586
MTTSNRLKHILITASLLSLMACSSTSEETTMSDPTQSMTNLQKAVAVISSIETGDKTAIAYINPENYTQHNLAVADGLAGFGAVLHQLPEGSAKARVTRAFQDGDYTVTHTEYNFFGPKVGFDVFRFEDGKIVEHWDNLQAIAPLNPSGRSQLDGATEVTDLDKTDANKAIVTDFVETILMNGDMSKIGQFIDSEDSDYIQHNPAITDGLSGLGKALGELAAADMPMVVSKNHAILGQGNFVLSINEGTFMNQHVAFYDLFRLRNGKIVEHWDTIETIPAPSEWQNPNGKFGF